MRRARRRDGQIKRQQATQVLQAMIETGEPITFPAVARRAGVSVTLLYADKSLAAGIAQARDRQRQAGRDRAWRLPVRALVTEQSLRADLANAKDQVRRLTEEVRLLRARLARDLGADADVARGRSASPLIDQIEQRAAELETDNNSLRLRVEQLQRETRELADSLDAARAMNRELMSELNRPSPDSGRQDLKARPIEPTTSSPRRRQRRPASR
jgi:hypothetical protein